jgi:hydrogenase small subunit
MKKKSEGVKTDLEERDSGIFGVSRRDFLTYCGGLAGALALGCAGEGEKPASPPPKKEKIARTIEKAAGKPPVIWLEGQDCAGCSISFLNAEKPSIAEVILDKISLRYHESVMAASGHTADRVMEETRKEGGYVLVVEGAVPAADDRFCMVGGRPFREILGECAKGAAAIIAVGACATYGGIPGAAPSQGKGISGYVGGRPVINLPLCPVHHEHLLATIVYYLENKKAPELDEHGRPLMFFAKTVHDQCERKEAYDAGNYLNDWNDPAQAGWCLAEKGCKGPETYSDCPTRKYNGGVNWCIGAGAPCQGCAEPAFYGQVSPLFASRTPVPGKEDLA